jgi:2,4-dienoyl-CoA reductase-like NADH-dependent reductase (Old Yellow Enzyme family)
MAKHEPFNFKSKNELAAKIEALGLSLPLSDDIPVLFQKYDFFGRAIPNRLAVHPMEGFDSQPDGSPDELALRRYQRFASGGSGLIWFEAVSVVPEGRSNPRQLWLHDKNVGAFSRLVEHTRRAARETFGSVHEPYLVMQLTHSGRYSRPEGKLVPRIAAYNPYLDSDKKKINILTDDELAAIQDKYVSAAGLAWKAGYDAVDIKACHGYLINDLLAAFKRKNSRYGGSFENRSRFLIETMERIKTEVPGIEIAVRLSLWDAIPYPFGFGVHRLDSKEPYLKEPARLIDELSESGCRLINVTMGNPYRDPSVGRPFDRPVPGSTEPNEHPLESIYRITETTAILQKQNAQLPFVGTGYSWLRQFWPYLAAAIIAANKAHFIGLGRSSFAYPDATRDLMENQKLSPNKVCIACSRCTELMRHGGPTGCVIRDKDIYAREYKRCLAL